MNVDKVKELLFKSAKCGNNEKGIEDIKISEEEFEDLVDNGYYTF